nr:DNA helicase INO80 isoform X2 [Tanacetum cinerariifolium]
MAMISDFRSTPCVFLGYSPSHHGYHCLDISTERLYIARHVCFNEAQFPFDIPKTTSSPPSKTSPYYSSESPYVIPTTDHPSPSSPRSPISSPSSVSHLSPTSQTSPESSNGQPSPVSTTSIPTPPSPTPPPPPPPPITRQRPVNLRQNPKQRVPYNPSANHATVLPTTITEPTSFTIANNSPEWRHAMKEEYDALMKNGTWSLVPRASNTNVVDDIQNAFLHGNLKEQVYMKQPPGFIDPQRPNHVCLLHKSLYGLKQAPRAWFERLSKALFDLGFKGSKTDPSLFIYSRGDTLLYILVYVDDIIVTGNNKGTIDNIICQLGSAFALKDLGSLNYFLGIEIVPHVSDVLLSQKKYILELLQSAGLSNCNPVSSPMVTSSSLSLDDSTAFSNPVKYRQVVGFLQYVTPSRPDIAFAVNKVCQYMHAPTENHWSAVKRILRYLHGTVELGMLIRCSSGSTLQAFTDVLWKGNSDTSLEAFSDADWAGDSDDRRSTRGFAIYLGSNLISWTARKQRTIDADCADRDFAYRKVEELHHPWIKRLLLGFARTSPFSGPRKPDSGPHHLIEEIDKELPVLQPALQLTHQIFGSCPPMQSFDPAKMLTDSGKLQTLDILLKRLRAGNHRVLLFAQMTKMLNVIEDYMNYRKYKYLRLDGSSTITDRRDMVKDFQLRSDIFVFLLSTRAGGVGINLTAADTVIFYESDWNPTLDLQAMDRAHRLGQTKDVTVYRLICKETVEEKILHRASQKSTVQQLVMTGGHIQGDLLAPEDVLSLLIDDPQMEQKLREIPAQVKDRQKRKGGTKAIRIDEEGDACLEDLMDPEPPIDAHTTSPSDKPMPSKKRKATDKGTAKLRTQKGNSASNATVSGSELDDRIPQRTKRPTKSVNENLEPAFTATVVPED